MTPTDGNSVGDNQNPIAASSRRLLLIQNHQSLEKLVQQSRERIPGRCVPARRSTTYGTLMITREIMQAPHPGAVKSRWLAVSS